MGFHVFQIHFHNRLSCSYQVAFFYKNREALAFKLYSINTNMHEHFLAAVGHNPDGMLAREYIEHFTVYL